jgi:transposase
MGKEKTIQEKAMLGKKRNEEPVFHYFRMHELIPDDYNLKLIDKHVDFSFVRERVKHLYSDVGRSSIDPEVMVKMLLVGYLNGITHERRLCREVAMHVGYRWFVGLNMEDRVPDHSTFSKNRRGRFAGSGLWEEIFDEIVRRCIEAGLVSGKHLTADGTLVEADAALHSMEPIVVQMTPAEYLKKIDEETPAGDDDGGRDDEFRKKGTKMSNATHRSTTDPDARIARKKTFSETKLCYQVGYLMDNASRVILDASVSSKCGRGAEMATALGGLAAVKWKYKLKPQTLGADKGYAAGQFITDVYEAGVTPHVPVWDTRNEHDAGIYPIEKFKYDVTNDRFICPRGKTLKHHGRNHKQEIYRASMKDCAACPAKANCTRDRSRSLSFHMHHEYIRRAGAEKKTKGYRQSQRNRKKIEELFGEAKEQMGLRRMKFRSLEFVKEQVFLTAAAQNIKRLVKYLERKWRKPAESVGIPRATAAQTALVAALYAFETLSRARKRGFLFPVAVQQLVPTQ